MKSRAARLALLVLFVLALGVTAFLFQKSESAQRTQLASAQAFSDRARASARAVLDLRAAQQAYVATGQVEDFWKARVSRLMVSLRDGLTTLRAAAATPDVQAQIDAALGSLQDFGQMDGRARDYVRTGQKLLASDLIFTNGSEQTDAAIGAIDRAAAAELEARNAAAATFERRQTFALIAAAAASALVVLLLLPTGERELAVPAFLERPEPGPVRQAAVPAPRLAEASVAAIESWTEPHPVTVESPIAAAVDPVAEDSAAPSDPVPAAAVPVAADPRAALDFNAVAVLCTELSCVEDTTALPALIERAASLLDATGIILWMADPDGRELTPVLAQGYPQHLINRLGTIPRNAENATAAAFRTGVLQTVFAEGASSAAFAVPLAGCGGAVGVMAAEVRSDSEKHGATLAAATILAAQLASLVGPAATHVSEPVEAANA